MAQQAVDRPDASAFVMEGGGMYSERNLIGFAIAKQVKQWIASSAKVVLKTCSGESFTYADFGVADGGMATVIAAAGVASVRKAERETNSEPHDIHVVVSDQADNDFGPFFREFQHQVGAAKDKVFVSALGRSFYTQCLPRGSVDLSLNCGASHWLDCDSPRGDRSLEQKAADDWTTLLTSRAIELRKGGRVILVNDRKSDPGGQTKEDVAFNQFQGSIDLLLTVVEEFVRQGRITAAEGKRMVYPAYSRVEAEQRAPFLDESSGVRRAGLKLVSFDTIIVPCPTKTSFLEGKINAVRLGKELAESIRSWGYNLVFGIFDSDKRSEQERKALAEEVFAALAKVYENKSDEVGLPYALTVIVAEKE